MKLTNRILFSLLVSTITFSAFGAVKDYANNALQWSLDNKKEIGTHTASFAGGALLMYLASNPKVKACLSKTASTASNYTKAKCKAVANYLRNLSKGKKIVAGTVAGVGAAGAYVYFDGPGVAGAKKLINKP